jgi:hypothetical protein
MEIKQTVLPNYGGSREEMGSGASSWTYGRGVIGSPGAEDNRVAVPMLIGLTASQALEALESVGLIPSPSTRTFGAEVGNDGTVAAQDPLTNTLVNAGSIVSYAIFEYTVPADLTISPASLTNTFVGWAFNVSGDQVPPISQGDRVLASGFYVIDENGNRNPNGSINVNGEWTIDQVLETDSGQPGASTQFSSAALRSEIGNLATPNASSFGTGTVAIYDDVQVYNQAFDFTTGTLQATTSADDGKVFIGLPNNDFKNSVLNEYPWLTSTSWQVRINSLSTTYPVSASLNESDLVLTPTAPMNSEFNSTITGDYWSISSVLVNSVTGVITINAYYT